MARLIPVQNHVIGGIGTSGVQGPGPEGMGESKGLPLRKGQASPNNCPHGGKDRASSYALLGRALGKSNVVAKVTSVMDETHPLSFLVGAEGGRRCPPVGFAFIHGEVQDGSKLLDQQETRAKVGGIRSRELPIMCGRTGGRVHARWCINVRLVTVMARHDNPQPCGTPR